MVTVVWDLAEPLSERRANEKVVVKPIGKEQLKEMGKIMVVTWRGFVKSPESAERYLTPHLEAGIEQPFIAYLETRPVGCVSPKVDPDSKVGILDGGVHVLPEYRRQRIGTALLLAALEWLRDHGMEKAKVHPYNPEGEEPTQRAVAFYLSTGGRTVE